MWRDASDKLTSAHQYLANDKAKSWVQRSSSTNMAVPNGWPPPMIASNSLRPEDVKVKPPLEGFVPILSRTVWGEMEEFPLEMPSKEDVNSVGVVVEFTLPWSFLRGAALRNDELIELCFKGLVPYFVWWVVKK